jgi:hypothetical protein
MAGPVGLGGAIGLEAVSFEGEPSRGALRQQLGVGDRDQLGPGASCGSRSTTRSGRSRPALRA